MVAGLGLHDALSPLAPALTLKWPNDLMAGPAKMAGILLEREADFVIAGFGVNLVHAPAIAGREITCLSDFVGGSPSPEAVLDLLVRSFADRLAEWRAEGIAAVRDAWLAAAHPVGTRLITDQGEGRFGGLDEQGALVLQTNDGSVRVVSAGDVFLL